MSVLMYTVSLKLTHTSIPYVVGIRNYYRSRANICRLVQIFVLLEGRSSTSCVSAEQSLATRVIRRLAYKMLCRDFSIEK